MIDAICCELFFRNNYIQNKQIETIYFGGGTPSILTQNELKQIIKTIRLNFDTSQLKEITLEANPDDICKERIKEWKELGINRLSIGIQSLKSNDLHWMNRTHTVDEALACIDTAKNNGIENLTIDLIYGLPNLTNEEWKNHIKQMISKGIQHISAYCLTIEEGTILENDVKKGKIIPASENQQSEQFLILLEIMEQHGFQQYEISNFCKPGFESIHNSNYWKGVHYLGIGPSAHSFNGKSRSWNISNNHQYMKAIEQKNAWYETEILSTKDLFNELILTGLRTKHGVDLTTLKNILPLKASFLSQIEQFINSGLMLQTNNQITLTKEGKLQADRIASDLFIL